MAGLSVKQLEALGVADAGKRLSDGHGLYAIVRVKKDGRVSALFRWRFRHGGKLHDFTAGTWPGVALAQIRKNRDEAERVLATGANPNDEAKAQRLAAHAEVVRQAEEAKAELARAAAEANALRSVNDVFGVWFNVEIAGRKDGGAELKRAWKKDVLPRIGSLPIRSVTSANVLEITDAIKNRDAARLARRTFGEVRQFLAFAFRRDYIDADPTTKIQKSKEFDRDDERERVLSEKELRALPEAFQSAGLLDSTRHALWVQLATACRIGEIAKAKRAEIDIDSATWTIPASNSKNGKQHLISLSSFALTHMRALLEASAGCEWLLPARNSKRGSESHVDPKSITKQVSDRQLKFYGRTAHSKRTQRHENALVLGNERWTPHDLRRTAATLMQQVGVLPEVIERVLNHVDENRIRRTYQRHDYRPQMQHAWQLLGDRLDLLTRDDADNVVVLKTANA